MVTNLYYNGIKITNANTILTSVKGSPSASIDRTEYQRGGRPGVVGGLPFYRNFALGLTFVIVGSSASDLATRRDAFMAQFDLEADKSLPQTKTVTFELANGVMKQIPVVVTGIQSDIEPENINHIKVFVTLRSEREFFTSTADDTQTIPLYQGGGMAVPMAIPMSMATAIDGEAIVINNAGNAEYYPTVRVSGTIGTFVIKNNTTGKQLDYAATLGASDYVDFDFYNRTAIKNGASNVLANVSGDWWWLKPGNNEIVLVSATGDGSAVVTYRDAYRGL